MTAQIYTLSLHDALPILQLLQKSAAQLRQHTDSLIAYYQNLPTEEQEKELERISNELRELIADYKARTDRKSTRLNSSHVRISYAVFCLKKKRKNTKTNL